MIQFIEIEGKGSVDIAFYDVLFDRQYTLGELIEEIKKQDEWGFIRAGIWKIQYVGNNVGFVPDWMRGSRIKRASAEGGWGRMDYHVDLFAIQFTEEKKLSIWEKIKNLFSK